jgi:aspartate/methionine/tyrosine aminotransferase
MLISVHIPPIDLFEWLLQNHQKASYNLAFSNIDGLTFEEYQQLTDFFLQKDFDLGVNAHYGADELKQILSEMYHCKPENIVTATGASEANFLVSSSLLTKDDDFIVEQPGYQPLWRTPEILGARRITWPRTFEKKFQLDIDVLDSLITNKTKLIVMTNLHNPSGVLTDKKTIEAVAEIARKHHTYLLIDEIFLDGSFTRQPSSFGIQNVIVTSSATKVYSLGGLHTGWVIAPKEIAELCQRMKAHTTAASSYLSELMTAKILSTARDDLIKRFQKKTKCNFLILKKWMNRNQELLEWIEPHGGIICFPKYKLNIPSIELCTHLLKDHKLLVNPGAYFNQERHIRLSYGCDEQILRKGLEALENGLKELLKEQ